MIMRRHRLKYNYTHNNMGFCVSVCVRAVVCEHACGGHLSMSGACLSHSIFLILGLSLNLDLAQAIEQLTMTLGICLSQPPQH